MKNKEKKKVVESTQYNIPIRDFLDGIVITKDEEYIKIIEVLPIPLFLKKPIEQNKIGDLFSNLLKAGPKTLHIKSVSIPSDLSHQISDVERSISSEKNASCKRMGTEYKETLENGQKYGITRRFFISFPYEGKKKGNISANFQEIKKSLEQDSDRLISSLLACGNEVVLSNDDNPNENNASLFYMLYNRGNFLEEPFDKHFSSIYKSYLEKAGDVSSSIYIPPTDYLAPKKMDFSSSKSLEIDGVYYSFLYIPSYGYNPNVVTGWLDNFVNSFNGIDVDIFLKQVPKESVKGSIKRNIARSTVSLSEVNDISDTFEQSSASVQAGYYLKEGLSMGQDFYYMSTIITVSGSSIEEVNVKKDEIKKIGLQLDVILKENLFECESTFNMVLPSSQYNEKYMKKMRRNVLTEGASSMYPFTTFQMIDSNGIYIADDSNGSPVITDPFNRQRFNNPHIFICGETGAGKTIALLLIALRARVKNLPVFILAPEKQDEFRRVCEAIGGQFVSIGSGSINRINIMDIFVPDSQALEKQRKLDGISSFESISYLSDKLATLMEFLELLIKDITMEEKQLLSEAIIETYKRKGITKDNSSLFIDSSRGALKEMPILSDLVSVLSEKNETARLSRIIKILTIGAGEHFNGQTNINVNNNFFVIGLEHNTSELLGLSIYMAMDYCWSRIKEDRTKNKFLFIDEWWKLAFNPIAAEKSLQISKIARALGCSMVLATQQMSDILAIEDGKYGNAVLNNCATKILMSMKEKDVYSVKEMVGLTNSECNRILRFKAGEGLLISGDNRLSLRFNPSYTEKLLTFTDQETLDEYARVKDKLSQYLEVDNPEILDKCIYTTNEILKNLSDVSLISIDALYDELERMK